MAKILNIKDLKKKKQLPAVDFQLAYEQLDNRMQNCGLVKDILEHLQESIEELLKKHGLSEVHLTLPSDVLMLFLTKFSEMGPIAAQDEDSFELKEILQLTGEDGYLMLALISCDKEGIGMQFHLLKETGDRAMSYDWEEKRWKEEEGRRLSLDKQEEKVEGCFAEMFEHFFPEEDEVAFEAAKEKNRELLELAEKIEEFVDFELCSREEPKDSQDANFKVGLSCEDFFTAGLTVTFENGQYELRNYLDKDTCLLGKVKVMQPMDELVWTSRSQEEVEEYLRFAFDRYRGHKQNFLFTISPKAFAVFGEADPPEIKICKMQKEALSEEEEKVLATLEKKYKECLEWE